MPTSIIDQRKSEQCFAKTIHVSIHISTMVHLITASQLPIYSANIDVSTTNNNLNLNLCARMSVFLCMVTVTNGSHYSNGYSNRYSLPNTKPIIAPVCIS